VLTVEAVDNGWNAASASVTFSVQATVNGLKKLVNSYYASHDITKAGVRTSLIAKLSKANKAIMYGNETRDQHPPGVHQPGEGQTGKSISPAASAVLIAEAKLVIASLR